MSSANGTTPSCSAARHATAACLPPFATCMAYIVQRLHIPVQQFTVQRASDFTICNKAGMR